MTHHYKLQCSVCGAELDDDGFILKCQIEHEPALLITRYSNRQFEPIAHVQDITRYRSWLPCQSNRYGAGRTIT